MPFYLTMVKELQTIQWTECRAHIQSEIYPLGQLPKAEGVKSESILANLILLLKSLLVY